MNAKPVKRAVLGIQLEKEMRLAANQVLINMINGVKRQSNQLQVERMALEAIVKRIRDEKQTTAMALNGKSEVLVVDDSNSNVSGVKSVDSNGDEDGDDEQLVALDIQTMMSGLRAASKPLYQHLQVDDQQQQQEEEEEDDDDCEEKNAVSVEVKQRSGD